jgi:polar amino acid transport system substrate-binding protein
MKIMLVGLLLFLNALALADEVRLVTLEYPPYTTQSHANGGSMIELTRRAFAVSGHTAIIKFRPWARALKEMREGKYDGILPLWPEDITAAKLDVVASRALAYSELGFFVRKDAPLTFSALEQLKGQRAGVARGYNYPDRIMNSGIVTEEAADDLTNLRKLAAKRFNLVVLEQQVGQNLLTQNPELQEKIAWQGQTLASVPLLIGFRQPEPDKPDWPALFAKGIDELISTGEYMKILQSSAVNP